MSKKIFIFPNITDLNRGDQALVWESIRIAEEVFPASEYFIFESGSTEEDTYLQTNQTQARGYHIVPRILKHPGRKSTKKNVHFSKMQYLSWGLTALSDLFITSMLISRIIPLRGLGKLFLSSRQKKAFKQFEECDIAFVKGGGFIHAYGKITDWYQMYFALYYVMLAHSQGKPVVILPNSIGPIKGRVSKWFVRRVLRRCQLLTVRENVSNEFVTTQLTTSTSTYPDLGFYLTPEKSGVSKMNEFLSTQLNNTDGRKLMGVTLRPYRFPNSTSPKEKYFEYIDEIATLVKLAVADNYHVIFYAHTLGPSSHEDDRIALKDVLKILGKKELQYCSYLEEYSHSCKEVMHLYANLDILVGTRFHSVIFAFNVRTPAVAIAYGGNKSYGIMADLDLSDFVFPIEQVDSGKMFEAIKKIESDKKTYLEKLDRYREFLTKERIRLADNIKSSLA